MAQVTAGDDTTFREEGRRFVGDNVAGGTLWYLSLACYRTPLNQIEFQVDRNANRQFNQRQRYSSSNYGATVSSARVR